MNSSNGFSTDNPAPSTTAPGQSHSATTSASPAEAAPGAPLSVAKYCERDQLILHVLLPLHGVAALLGYALYRKSQEGTWGDLSVTLHALYPTLMIFAAMVLIALGWFMHQLKCAIRCEAISESDQESPRPLYSPSLPPDHAVCTRMINADGVRLVVIHNEDGFVRFKCDRLWEHAIAGDTERCMRWLDKPINNQ